MKNPKTTALYCADQYELELRRYEPSEMLECFLPAEREALARGEVITRGKTRWVSATALAKLAFGV